GCPAASFGSGPFVAPSACCAGAAWRSARGAVVALCAVCVSEGEGCAAALVVGRVLLAMRRELGPERLSSRLGPRKQRQSTYSGPAPLPQLTPAPVHPSPSPPEPRGAPRKRPS